MSGVTTAIPDLSSQNVTDLLNRVQALEGVGINHDTFFLMINATLVYFMQAGFALIVIGSVRVKHTTSVILKNYVDTVFCGIGYWIFGYALAFGANPNSFCGTRNWAGETLDPQLYVKWFYQYSFASTSATIVSGAIAERCRLEAYMLYSFFVSGFIYPIQSHWAWDPSGWLAKGDGTAYFQDFSGSGIVHLCGGTISLVATIIIGPRIGRFTGKQGENLITHHNMPLFSLGGFILFMGFMAFNGSSGHFVTLPGDGVTIGTVVRNSIISGSFGAAAGMFASRVISHFKTKGNGKYSLFATVNCGLAGIVAVCAGCNLYYGWGSAIVGTIAGLSYFFWSWLLVFYQIDDAIDAVAVHLGGGLCGLLLQPILKRDGLVFRPGDAVAWRFFAWNICGAVVIMLWAGGLSLLMFGGLRLVKFFRVEAHVEEMGIDIADLEENTYPEDNPTGKVDSPNQPIQLPYAPTPVVPRVTRRLCPIPNRVY